MGILPSCTETDAPKPQDAPGGQELPASGASTPTAAGCTVLGERIPLPYTTDVMRKAVASLKAGNKSAEVGGMPEDDIRTTHLYLRFAPRDSADMADLEGDTTIMFTEIPMDAEIDTIGDYYHDPSLPDSVPTFQYCTVRVGQEIPDIPHETLAELFPMEEANACDEEEATANKTASALWESLEAEAYHLVGLEEAQTTEENTGNANKSKWRPGGHLRYRDTTTGKDIPMEGVPIRYQKLVVAHQCCTDANGHFSFGRRRSKFRYYAKWRRDDFHIRGLGKVLPRRLHRNSGGPYRRQGQLRGNERWRKRERRHQWHNDDGNRARSKNRRNLGRVGKQCRNIWKQLG